MKRFSIGILIGLLAGLILATTTFAIAAPGTIKLIVNEKEIQCDVPPRLINGRVMVPARFVAEPLGAKVGWDDAKNAVIITGNSSLHLSNNTSTTRQNLLTESTQIITANIGETVELNDLRIKIKQVKYSTAEGGSKAFRVYFTVINNSTEALQRAAQFKFSLKEKRYEQEVNSLGFTHCVNKTGWIYPGESVSGYYEYIYPRNITITSVQYAIPGKRTPLAEWIIK